MKLPPTNARTLPKGFTLVELLVSLALVIFIMSLLSTVFVLATKTFRDMKAAGDLQEQLRSAAQVIKSLIQAPHFLEGNRRVNLSDPNFWNRRKLSPTDSDNNLFDFKWRSGYFRLDRNRIQDQIVNDLTGTNSLNLCGLYDSPETPSQAADHRLSMTCMLSGRLQEDFFTQSFSNRASLPSPFNIGNPSRYETDNSLFRSPYAEVLFYLQRPTSVLTRTGTLSERTDGLPLFDLHLKTWLINPEKTNLAQDFSSSFENKLSLSPYNNGSSTIYVFNDLTFMGPRSNRATFRALSNLSPDASLSFAQRSSSSSSDTILLKNLVSFEVQIFELDPVTKNLIIFNLNNFDSDYQSNEGQGKQIVAVKIILRVYDPDNEITRQMTIVEPL